MNGKGEKTEATLDAGFRNSSKAKEYGVRLAFIAVMDIRKGERRRRAVSRQQGQLQKAIGGLADYQTGSRGGTTTAETGRGIRDNCKEANK